MTTDVNLQNTHVDATNIQEKLNREDDVTQDEQIVEDTNNSTDESAIHSAKNCEQQLDKDRIIDNKETEQVEADSKHSQNTRQPNISWRQSKKRITLRIYVKNVVNFKAYISGPCNRLIFECNTKQLSPSTTGLPDYHFEFDLYSVVDRRLICYKLKNYLSLQLEKILQPEYWPTLTKTYEEDPDWIRYDSDVETHDNNEASSDTSSGSDDEFISGSEGVEELLRQLSELSKNKSRGYPADLSNISSIPEDDQAPKLFKPLNLKEAFANSRNINQDIFNPFKKKRFCKKGADMKYDYRQESKNVDTSKNTARQAMDYKKTYLFLYNLLLFVVFLMVNLILVIKGLSGTIDDDSVRGAAYIIKLLTYTQLLESIHPILGLVPGGPLMPFIQVIGRLIVNLFLTEATIRLDSAPYPHLLFVVWTGIEIFRYSFYALRVFKVEIYPITWCRYTLFIPLYPMGGFCESMIILSSIKYYEETGDYSISLPNSANFSFCLPVALRIYTYLILGPTIFKLMKYMMSQRSKQLKSKLA